LLPFLVLNKKLSKHAENASSNDEKQNIRKSLKTIFKNVGEEEEWKRGMKICCHDVEHFFYSNFYHGKCANF
jgi:hypothetical protein